MRRWPRPRLVCLSWVRGRLTVARGERVDEQTEDLVSPEPVEPVLKGQPVFARLVTDVRNLTSLFL